MKKNLYFLIAVCLIVPAVQADIKLPGIFTDHMVLQRQSQVTVWGWAEPGEKIKIKPSWQWFASSATADDDGRFQVKIKTTKTKKPCKLTIKGNNEIVLNDILMGEVWICSGQSNMEWNMGGLYTDTAANDIQKADMPNIRLFTVQNKTSTRPLEDVVGTWQVCTPKTVAAFSATGYYFGRTLSEKLDVPIGLISADWGGTLVQAWTSRETLEGFDVFKDQLKTLDGAKNDSAEPAATNPNIPAVLYNGMIAPLLPLRIAGVIWYQGESNCYDPIQYRELFPAMIADWRKNFNHSDMPFYYVQIAPYIYDNNIFSQALREAQMLSMATPNTGMAVIMDIGEEKDIHPQNKWDVGERLARWALAKDYGKTNVVYSGPIYKSMKVEGNSIRVSFDYVEGGLEAADGGLKDFVIAGTDKHFVPAAAVIDGDTIVVSSDQVTAPVAVRYGWGNWIKGTLFNKEKLPASSFRTDDWPIK